MQPLLLLWGKSASSSGVVINSEFYRLYGAFRRKRFMKNFWKPEVFVWLCHIGIGIWYLITYYQIYRDERTQHCINERAEDDDIAGAGLCWHLLSFGGAPLPYVWVTFVVQTVVQTRGSSFRLVIRRVNKIGNGPPISLALAESPQQLQCSRTRRGERGRPLLWRRGDQAGSARASPATQWLF